MNLNEVFILSMKELKKFFGNKRILFATSILPGLVIFIVYSFMGYMITKESDTSLLEAESINVINLSVEMEDIFSKREVNFIIKNPEEKEYLVSRIQDQSEKLLINFPEDFELIHDDLGNSKSFNVEIYYNSSDTGSLFLYNYMCSILNEYEQSFINLFDINEGNQKYNLAIEKQDIGKKLSSILPMLLMGLIFSSCITLASESIAGEKEHGTMATLLVTPIRRSSIAIGKVFSLGIIALISGISSFTGIIFSLPSILNLNMLYIFETYSITDYIIIFLMLFSTILVLISLMQIVSTCSKSIKEASTSLSPFAAVVMLIGLSCLMQSEPAIQRVTYIIPLYNSVQFLYSILVFKIDVINFFIMFISNLGYTTISICILIKLFKSEKVMFW